MEGANLWRYDGRDYVGGVIADSDVTWGHRTSHDGDISLRCQCSRC